MSMSRSPDNTPNHRVAFLNSVFLFAGIVALGMGFYRWQSNHLMGLIDSGFAIGNFSLVYYLNRRPDGD